MLSRNNSMVRHRPRPERSVKDFFVFEQNFVRDSQFKCSILQRISNLAVHTAPAEKLQKDVCIDAYPHPAYGCRARCSAIALSTFSRDSFDAAWSRSNAESSASLRDRKS